MSQNYFLNIISSRPFKYEQILLKGIHHVRTLNFEVGNFAFIETHLVERVAIMDMDRGGGTGRVRGGSDPPRIRDLFSKIFENSQKKIFFSIGPPLGKNRSHAPVYGMVVE